MIIQEKKGTLMNLAVISDIHANYKAFEAFLNYIEPLEIDGIICLGDYLTDSPYPRRTLNMLYGMMEKYTCYMVRGNREEYLINNFHNPQGWKPSSPSGTLYYTSQSITEADIHFFESLPIVETLQFEEYPILTICHGTPEDSRGNLGIEMELRNKVMQEISTKYLLGGHSHHQEVDTRFGKTYINPGSLGLAIDGKGSHAEFAMMHGVNGDWEPELVSIPYDVNTFLQDFTTSGLDEYGMILNRAVKKTLTTGINYFYLSVFEAQKIMRKPLAEIPEEVWEQVGSILKLGE